MNISNKLEDKKMLKKSQFGIIQQTRKLDHYLTFYKNFKYKVYKELCKLNMKPLKNLEENTGKKAKIYGSKIFSVTLFQL